MKMVAAASQLCRILLAAFILSTCCLKTYLQPAPKISQEPIPSNEIQSIILNAQVLEPELTADIFLKLVIANKIKSKSQKQQLLKDAFYLSYGAKNKVRRKSIPVNGEVLTNQTTFISNSHNFGLDTLSLQTRIVIEISKLDRKLGYELFSQISTNLSLKPLTCEDFLLYELSDLYSSMIEISRLAFNEQEILEGKRIIFLSSYLENMTSPSQVSPISKMLSSLSLRDEEMNYLASVYSKTLRKVRGDDQSFSYSMNFENAFIDLARFSQKLHYNPAAYDEFRQAFREYLTSNLNGPRCESNIKFETSRSKVHEPGTETPDNGYLPIYILGLNRSLFKESPISAEEAKSKVSVKTNFLTQLPKTNQLNSFQTKLDRLRFWKDELQTTSEQKQEYGWQEEFLKILESIAEIKSKDTEEEMETFHQKCLLYRLMLREAQDVKLKVNVVKNYVALLNDNSVRKNSISEWFLEFDSLRKEIKEAGQKEKALFYSVLQASNNNAISVYVELEKALKQTVKPAQESQESY